MKLTLKPQILNTCAAIATTIFLTVFASAPIVTVASIVSGHSA